MNKKIQSLGGKAKARKERIKALERYYKEPQKCKTCNKIIIVGEKETVSQTKKKRFCNHSCAAKYNNILFPKRKKQVKQKSKKSKNTQTILNITKKELFNKRTNWQSARSAIQKHARLIYNKSNKEKHCFVCGYNKHYEVAHIKPVALFDELAKIADINDIQNLIALCPNHHWEFDKNLIKLNCEVA